MHYDAYEAQRVQALIARLGKSQQKVSEEAGLSRAVLSS